MRAYLLVCCKENAKEKEGQREELNKHAMQYQKWLETFASYIRFVVVFVDAFDMTYKTHIMC